MYIKGLSLLILGVGVFFLMQVAMPLLSFKTWEIFAFESETQLIDPQQPQMGSVDGISIEDKDGFSAFIASLDKATQSPYKQFSLEIPSIGLKKTSVVVNSNNFEQTLAHLPGSALPGDKGNPFITGHSSLPNPFAKDKKAFFVNLPKVKKGDEIKVEALGQSFTYEVIGLRIIDPKEIWVIKPPDTSGRYISLMTCVPPGLSTKRLIVLGRLKGS